MSISYNILGEKKMDYYIQTLPDDICKNSPYKRENGIVLTKIPYTQDFKPHTTTIASEALRGDKTSLRWLVENIGVDGGYYHDFTLPFHDFKAPWVGGLAQGLAISALVRASEHCKNPIYLEVAEKAFEGLKKHCYKSGWIYEYPGVKSILNGFIYALFGVLDLSNTGHKGAKRLYNRSFSTFIENLPSYDLGYWSRYSLMNDTPATKFYHQIHVDQLFALYRVSGHPMLMDYHFKFKEYMSRRFCYAKSKLVRLWGYMDTPLFTEDGLLKKYNKRRKWLKTNNVVSEDPHFMSKKGVPNENK